jgi:hypothetical protein
MALIFNLSLVGLFSYGSFLRNVLVGRKFFADATRLHVFRVVLCCVVVNNLVTMAVTFLQLSHHLNKMLWIRTFFSFATFALFVAWTVHNQCVSITSVYVGSAVSVTVGMTIFLWCVRRHIWGIRKYL